MSLGINIILVNGHSQGITASVLEDKPLKETKQIKDISDHNSDFGVASYHTKKWHIQFFQRYMYIHCLTEL